MFQSATVYQSALRNTVEYEQALYLANAGVHHAVAELENDTTWRGTVSAGSYPASGSYSATAVNGATAGTVDVTATGVAGGGNIGLGTLGRNLDINAVVQALQQANDARLLANPSVAVLENEEAIFKSVSEIPFQQLTQTQQGGNIGTTSFKEAGITLTVLPKIAADGTILMDVSPEFSRLAGFTPGDNQPIIDTRSASTSLTVANRQTVVIGGLRQRSDIGDFSGIPYLKDIRGVGRLFRSRETTVRESELWVFICPEIISYTDDLTWRQQIAADTIGCRLEQIPQAEGCPPSCRRLPPNLCDPGIPGGEFSSPHDGQIMPADDTLNPTEVLRRPEVAEPLHMPAEGNRSAELQSVTVGRGQHARVLESRGQLRRLPAVAKFNASPQPATGGRMLFGAPPAAPTIATHPRPAVRR